LRKGTLSGVVVSPQVAWIQESALKWEHPLMPSPHPLCNILYTVVVEKGGCKVAWSSSVAFSCNALAFSLCNELGDQMHVTRVTHFIPARAKVLTRFPHKAQRSCGEKI